MSPRITVGTYSITWDDTWHCIEVNGSILHLSPTQYRICRSLPFRQRDKEWSRCR